MTEGWEHRDDKAAIRERIVTLLYTLGCVADQSHRGTLREIYRLADGNTDDLDTRAQNIIDGPNQSSM